jgi:hypothetical protein
MTATYASGAPIQLRQPKTLITVIFLAAPAHDTAC